MVLELKSRTIIAPINLHSSTNSIGVSRRSNVCPILTDLQIARSSCF